MWEDRHSRALTVAGLLLTTMAGCGDVDAMNDADTAMIEVTDVELLGAGSDEVFGVRDLQPGDSGTVWVLNDYEPYLLLLSRSGEVERALGRQGGGPGEFGSPWQFVETHDGSSVEVWDLGRRRIVRQGKDGDEPTSVSFSFDSGFVRSDISQISYGTAGKAARWGSGYVVQSHPEGVRHTRDLAYGVLLATDSSGAVRDTIRDWRAPSTTREEILGAAETFIPIPLWVTCNARELVIFDPYARTIERYAEDGTRLSTDALPAVQSRPVADDEIRNHLRHVLEIQAREANQTLPENFDALVDQILESGRSMFGRTAPAAVELLCGPDGNVWLQQFDATDNPLGYGREWRVLREGETRAVIRFPRGFQPVHVGADEVWGVTTDEMGVERPARVSLPDIP